MEYKELVDIYNQLEKTTKRLEKTEILSLFLKKVPTDELSTVVCLLQGRVFPNWDERKIGFSSRLMLKAIAAATGTDPKDVEKLWSKTGDLGIVIEQLVKKKSQMTLTTKKITVKKLTDNVRKLADIEGQGTVDRKIGLVSELLTSSSAEESRFIVRTVLEVLRVGTAEGIVRDAIAKAFTTEIPHIERAFNILNDYGEVALAAKKGRLDDIQLTPGKPLKLMLSLIAEDIDDAFENLGKPAQFEYKLDGFRLQIHIDKDKVLLFTRRLDNVTKQFPDVVKAVKDAIECKNAVLDAEAIGFDPDKKYYLPFQKMSQRIKRKYDIDDMAKKFPVEINFFDIMYLNGKELIESPLKERRSILEKTIKKSRWKTTLTEKIVTGNAKEAEEFFKKSLNAGHEGVMIKNLDSLYIPGRYVGGWLKLKSVLEPLDVVIVKAEYGEGKRATWLTSYTIACKENGQFVEVGRVSTGLKEKESGGEVTFEEMTRVLKPLIKDQKGKEVTVEPEIVLEVEYEEVQQSPTYTSGFALRFPRIKSIREDKPVSEISTMEMVKLIYRTQHAKKSKT